VSNDKRKISSGGEVNDKNEIESRKKESLQSFFFVCDFIAVGRDLSEIFGSKWRLETCLGCNLKSEELRNLTLSYTLQCTLSYNLACPLT